MNHALSTVFTCLALIAVPASLPGQDKPSFAGTWKLSDPATPEVFTPTAMTVVQDATTLTVTTTSQPPELQRRDDRPDDEAGLGWYQADVDHDVEDGRADARVQVGMVAGRRWRARDRDDRS